MLSATSNIQVKEEGMVKIENITPVPFSFSSSTSLSNIQIEEETVMKFYSGLIQESFGTLQSLKRTTGAMKIHWRVSVRIRC